MAARLKCQECGRSQFFRDRETPTLTCGRCIERMRREAEEQARLDAIDGITLTDKDGELVAKLVTLAANAGAAENESANAARAACQILMDKGGVELIKHHRHVRRRGGRG